MTCTLVQPFDDAHKTQVKWILSRDCISMKNLDQTLFEVNLGNGSYNGHDALFAWLNVVKRPPIPTNFLYPRTFLLRFVVLLKNILR